MLFSFAQFCIDKVALVSNISHDGRVPVKALVCAGYAFFAGLGVVKWCNVDIQRHFARRQSRRGNLMGAEHIDIRPENLLPKAAANIIHPLPEGFRRRNAPHNAESVHVELRVVFHLIDSLKRRLRLTEQTDIGEQDIAVLDLRLAALFVDRDTVATLDEIALGKHSADNAETAWR